MGSQGDYRSPLNLESITGIVQSTVRYDYGNIKFFFEVGKAGTCMHGHGLI